MEISIIARKRASKRSQGRKKIPGNGTVQAVIPRRSLTPYLQQAKTQALQILPRSASFQTISSMIMMPLTFVSGAYIPTTMMPGFLLPVVYLNPLTYVTSIFRYIALGAYKMSSAGLVREGMAFNIYGFIITPVMGLMITVLIGTAFFALSVGKFNQADFSTVKVAKAMRGGGAPR